MVTRKIFSTTAACSCEKPDTTLTCELQNACNDTMTLRGVKCILYIKKTEQNNSRLLKKASFISKYNTKLYLRNTQSCNVKTWLCAFQFLFKISSGVQMVHTSSTNSTDACGLHWMIYIQPLLLCWLTFRNLLLHQDSLTLKKYSVFSAQSPHTFLKLDLGA